MTDLLALRTQEYSTNLELLSQQMTPRVAGYCRTQQASGNKAFRMLSQAQKTNSVDITTSATPAMNIDVTLDGRWVFPTKKGWGTVVDELELMQTNIAPQGAFVRDAVAALNRDKDDLFINAFFGNAQTGETGGTSTAFDTNNQIAASEGSTTGLNIDKLRAAQQILLENEVDIDMEKIYIAMSPKQHDDLLALTQVTSTDFNTRPVLGTDGMVRQFLGMNIVITNRLPTDGSGDRRLPVWVESGMGCGMWKDITGTVRTRPDLHTDPDYVEATLMIGFTRLEEAKCVEIKATE